MKNFKFINQSLWAGSSPNQTGETLTRENRIGVKSWLNRGLMLLITILTLGVGQMWGADYTFYVISSIFSSWDDESTIYLGFNYYDSGDKWCSPYELSYTGNTYKGGKIYSATINSSDAKLFFMRYKGGSEKERVQASSGSDWTNVSGVVGKIYVGWNGSSHQWDDYKTDHSISAGTTIVWDMAGNESGWSASHIYRDVNGGSGSNDEMYRIGSTTQWYKTYNSASNNIASIQFRSNTSNWNSYTHTTNIERNISGVTLFTNLNTSTNTDPRRLNWQVTENAKKATSGVKIYFDNTAAGWSKIRLKYGTAWFNRSSASDATKVSGTDNLYVIEMPNDAYYEKYYLADHYGYTNYNSIETMNDISNRINYQASDLSSDITYIPSTGSGAGTAGNPKVWTTTTISGHTRNVTIGSHTHGTITVSYTNESNIASSSTSTLDVAQTCIVSATATADNGYDYISMTLGDSPYTPGTSYIVRSDVTFTATFTAHTYGITLNKGDHGAANQSATVDFDATGLKSVTHVSANAGYQLEGYYDGSTKVLNANGSFAADNVTGYITGGKWSKYDADATLTAKFSPVELTFKSDASTTAWGTASNWNPACVPTIEHDIIIKSPVVVNVTTAKAKSVIIYNDGEENTGKLTIGAETALVVAEDIQKTTDGSTYGQTTADVLHIEAGNISDANGALVWGTSGTPGAAQVDFFTKSHGVKNSDESINQYIGTPFSNDQSILYQYYYSWIFEIERDDYGQLNWKLMAGDDSMNEFEGYNLITAYDANTTYQMEGTLVSNADVTLSTSSATGLPKLVYTSGDGSNPNNENVLANSWVAPIKIKALSGFTDVESSIYIFNACNANDYPFGNYTTYSISLAEDNVIPSMQSFSVYATGENPSITLNYNTIVKSPLSSAYNNSANKAPAHDRADEMDLLKVRIDGENGWADELKIYIHEDFSNAFEDSWDAHKMYGYPEAPQLYAVTTDGNMAINCVPTADNNVLGFTPGSENNEYTFSFTYDGDEEYYLKDTKLNIETLINTEATYTFTSEAEDSDMRFIIIKRAPAVATDAETVSGDRLAVSGVQKIMHNGQLYIIRDGEIYDATGTMVK